MASATQPRTLRRSTASWLAAVPPIKLDPFFEVRTPEPFGSRLVAWPSVGCRYQPRPADASASSAAIGTWAASTGHVTPPPGGSSPTCSRGYPEVRTTQRRGQRIFTSHARSTPSITPGSRTSAKIMATSRPPISRVASAASSLSHSMVYLFVFEQRRHQVMEFSVVLDDQYGSTFLLPLPHHRAPPLSVRRHRHVIGAPAPPAVPAAGTKQRRRISPVALPQVSAGVPLFGRVVLGASGPVLRRNAPVPNSLYVDKTTKAILFLPPTKDFLPGVVSSSPSIRANPHHRVIAQRQWAYCRGTDRLVPCMKAWISSSVRRPSLLALNALPLRSRNQ